MNLSIFVILVVIMIFGVTFTLEKVYAGRSLEDIGDDMRDLFKNNRNNNDKVSIADEIREFSKLKQEGILTDDEFGQMKEDVFKNNRNDNDDFSVADKLRELAQLKKEGIITEEEFAEMKEDLIK